MSRILTSMFAPTVFASANLLGMNTKPISISDIAGDALVDRISAPLQLAEEIGVDYLLVAQRWWGNSQEIEGSTYDCLAATAFFAAQTKRLRLLTAIHPGFFQPTAIAKWGATIDRLTGGRWAVNVTSGWNEAEFHQYGVDWLDHDRRYARSREFIDVLRGAWQSEDFSYDGEYYRADHLQLEPRPVQDRLEIWQGGQSEAARNMAASHSDWMFLNGGPPEKIGSIIDDVRARAAKTGRTVRFGLFGIPICRETDAEAEAVVQSMVDATDQDAVAKRRLRVDGAEGMWQRSDDPLTTLDTNEGFASRLIGSPETIIERILEFHRLGVDCLHTVLIDDKCNREVLPRLPEIPHTH